MIASYLNLFVGELMRLQQFLHQNIYNCMMFLCGSDTQGYHFVLWQIKIENIAFFDACTHGWIMAESCFMQIIKSQNNVRSLGQIPVPS